MTIETARKYAIVGGLALLLAAALALSGAGRSGLSATEVLPFFGSAASAILWGLDQGRR